tara:strand:- start:114 stop:881 length:768 start_codon:yes stop_codon:yes gene_type:complete
MAQRQQYIGIEEVINGYLLRSDQSNHSFYKCWHIAFDGMTQLGLDFFYQIKSVKLPINANLTVTLPADYLNYSKIGVLNGAGEIIPLSYNSKLTTAFDLSSTRLTQTQDDTISTLWQANSPIWYNYWNGSGYSNLYGIPSGAPFVGSFKVDNANGVIVLDENFSYEYLMVEYVASPQEGVDCYIPIQFKEALMWFIAWQDISMMPNTRKGSLGDKAQREKNYFRERKLANARWRPFDIMEAYEWSLKNQRLVVKS